MSKTLSEQEIEQLRPALKLAFGFDPDSEQEFPEYTKMLDTLCDLALSAKRNEAAPAPAKQEQAEVGEVVAHDWKPDGGEVRFESHPGGEAPHIHTTCSQCGTRMWWNEHQWSALSAKCAEFPWMRGSEAPLPSDRKLEDTSEAAALLTRLAEAQVCVPMEIDRARHGSVLLVWNDCMIAHESLEMTWPKLVSAMLTAAQSGKEGK